MVIVGDLARVTQERIARTALGLGIGNGIAAEHGVGLHGLEFFRGQLARLEQDAVRNADLADIVQRRGLEQQVDRAFVQLRAESRVMTQRAGQCPHIVLGAADVVAGLVVAGFGERGQRDDGRVLDLGDLARAPLHLGLQIGRTVAQEIVRLLER